MWRSGQSRGQRVTQRPAGNLDFSKTENLPDKMGCQMVIGTEQRIFIVKKSQAVSSAFHIP